MNDGPLIFKADVAGDRQTVLVRILDPHTESVIGAGIVYLWCAEGFDCEGCREVHGSGGDR